jgi:predicted enzyme related to lactoylglutathione lyase
VMRPALTGATTDKEPRMPHPIVHAEIRSSDPDATREFFAKLFGWSYSDGAYPGYTFVASGAEGGPATAISPLQAETDQVLFFVGVEDVAAVLSQAEALGGSVVQPAQQVPGVSFGVFADPHGHQIGVAAQG